MLRTFIVMLYHVYVIVVGDEARAFLMLGKGSATQPQTQHLTALK